MVKCDEIKEKIREYLINELKEVSDGSVDIKIQDGDNLLNGDILNSLGIVKFISFIEETFNVDVIDASIELEDFSTINSICALIEKRLS